VVGYVPGRFTCQQTVTHPSKNRAWCRATTLIKTTLYLYTTTPPVATCQMKLLDACLFSRQLAVLQWFSDSTPDSGGLGPRMESTVGQLCVYHCGVPHLVRVVNPCCSDSTFYPSWEGKMSVGFGADNGYERLSAVQ